MAGLLLMPFFPRITHAVELDGLPAWAVWAYLAAVLLELGVALWGVGLLYLDWRKGRKK